MRFAIRSLEKTAAIMDHDVWQIRKWAIDELIAEESKFRDQKSYEKLTVFQVLPYSSTYGRP